MASWSMFQDQETNKFTNRLNNKWRTQNVDTASYPARVYYELQKSTVDSRISLDHPSVVLFNKYYSVHNKIRLNCLAMN